MQVGKALGAARCGSVYECGAVPEGPQSRVRCETLGELENINIFVVLSLFLCVQATSARGWRCPAPCAASSPRGCAAQPAPSPASTAAWRGTPARYLNIY